MICIKTDCEIEAVKNSNYCPEHYELIVRGGQWTEPKVTSELTLTEKLVGWFKWE